MSDVVTAARAAAAALAAAAGGAPVAVAMLIVPGERVRRCIVTAEGAVEGALGGGADEVARRIAAELLSGGAEERRSGGAGATAGREVAGRGEVAGKGEVSGKGEVPGKGEVTGKGEVAGRGGVTGKGEVTGKDEVSGRVDVPGNVDVPGQRELPVVATVVVDDVECTLYVELHRAPEQLVIVGAGHIAVPLAHLGVLLDFRVTVLDDREEMATPERFDDAVHVIRADFATDPFAGIALGGSSYVALVTRGHRWDFDCLQRVIRRAERPRYIGMIGSRRRVRAAFHALLESGVSRELLTTIRAPIGLELQAETPAEIAIAIAAEIVAVRRGAEIGGIGARERVLERLLQ